MSTRRKRKPKPSKWYLLWAKSSWNLTEDLPSISRYEEDYYKNLQRVKVEEDEQLPTSSTFEQTSSTSEQTTEGSFSENNVQHDSLEKCVLYDKEFRIKKSRLTTSHIQTHTSWKPYECHLCHKRFSFKDYLKRHFRSQHTGEKNFLCDVCNKSFTDSSNLKRHQYKHGGEKPFSCSFCDKQFTSNWNLQRHERTHTKEKPFECHQCKKAFAAKCNLNTHLKVHTEEKIVHL